MRVKSLVAFAMAIGCGLVAMVGVQQALKQQSKDQDADKVTVFVASTEIPPGQVLDPTMLEKQKFLKGSVPKDAVTDLAQLEKRALIVKVMRGDIIRLDKLGEPGKTGASISIAKGMRVVTVPANTTLAHSGMLKPEDRVDVMVTYRVQPAVRGGRDYSETKTFLSYIQVFATDSVRDPNAGADPSGKASVLKAISLQVTPEQAQTIAMATSIGEISINLRNASDTQVLEVNNLTPDQFRTQILQASLPPADEPKAATETSEPRVPKDETLEAFVEDAIGEEETEQPDQIEQPGSPVKSGRSGKSGRKVARAEPTREAWDITIFSKAGAKVETVEVERRKELAKATQIIETDSDAKKLLNSLIDIVQPKKQEVVSLKPVQVGRPIYDEFKSDSTLKSLQAGLKKGTVTLPARIAPSSDRPQTEPKAPSTPKSATPTTLKPVDISTTPAKSAPAVTTTEAPAAK